MLHKLHRTSAIIIGLFILLHLINHSMIILGAQNHIEFMDAIRVIYRNAIVESLLILCILFQVSSGVVLVWKRRGQRTGFIEKSQVWSGLYLAFFLINHLAAVFFGRLILELDSNIYFAIAGFYVLPFSLFFIPYYFLAVVAIFVHLASAFNWLLRNKIKNPIRKNIVFLIMFIGIGFALILIFAFLGFFSDINIPAEYLKVYQF
ncbi:MAG: hypothetical protein HRU38_03900 [Saccharospirillaceae bacterium]|nr:hypothetical protein [Pseudomonadales bacterium]NRB77808.1 hypothetical protein [Saccharospirillaceae bacterium]